MTYEQPAGPQTSAASAPVMPGWNVLAIIGSIVSVLGMPVVGIVLAAVGLGQIRRTGERGRGLAIAGIIVGSVVVLAYIALGIFLLVGLLIVSSSSGDALALITG